MNKRAVGYILSVLGGLFMIVGILFGAWLPGHVTDTIELATTICSADEVTESFTDPHGPAGVPFYFAYHPFHVENAETYLSSSTSESTTVKPAFREKGPYVYRKFVRRTNVEFHAAKGTVSYDTNAYFEFAPELSCESCDPDVDSFTSVDTSYLALVTKANGERQFTTAFLASMLRAKGLSDPEISTLLTRTPALPAILPQLMKVLNGLNSLHVPSMVQSLKQLGKLTNAPDLSQALNDLVLEELSGFAFSGVLTNRSVSQLALGYPSFLAGMGLSGAFAASSCASSEEAASSPPCLELAAQLEPLTQSRLCDQVEADLTLSSKNDVMAQTLVDQTCRLCTPETGYRFCLVQIPGQVGAPTLATSMSTNTEQHTGCHDLSRIGQIVAVNEIKTVPVWNRSDVEGFPTPGDIQNFRESAICGARDVTCVPVSGGDGATFVPAGVTVSGLATQPAFTHASVYVQSVAQDLTFVSTNEVVRVHDIPLHRFTPAPKSLHRTSESIDRGTGLPHHGLTNLAYVRGLPVYTSYPMFLHGAPALFRDITLFSKSSGNLTLDQDVFGEDLEGYNAKYGTYVDIEPATGKTMHARSRLMASVSIPTLAGPSSNAVSNLNFPNIQTNVVLPLFWGEERSTITPELAKKWKSIESLARAFLPILVIGLVVGMLLVVNGIYLIKSSHKQQTEHYRQDALVSEIPML